MISTTCSCIHIIPLFDDAEFLCYDDGCHLRKYAYNECRRGLTTTTKKLASTEIVIDRMHFRGHIP